MKSRKEQIQLKLGGRLFSSGLGLAIVKPSKTDAVVKPERPRKEIPPVSFKPKLTLFNYGFKERSESIQLPVDQAKRKLPQPTQNKRAKIEPAKLVIPNYGNSFGRQRLQHWLSEHARRNPLLNRALLIWGPHGCGKTTAARLVLAECGYETLEFSAVDRRDPSDLELVASAASGRCDSKLAILITDLEALSTTKQKASISALKEMICPWRFEKRTSAKSKLWKAPFILIANQRDSPAMHSIVSVCDEIEFKSLEPDECTSIAQSQAQSLGFEIPADHCSKLVEQCRGNAAQVLAMVQLLHCDVVSGQPLGSLETADLFVSATHGVQRLFANPTYENAALALSSAVSLTPLLVQENVVAAQDLDALCAALDSCSAADVLEEQALVRLRPELREAHMVCAILTPAFYAGTPTELTYPAYRSFETRFRNAQNSHSSLALKLRCSDPIYISQVAEHVALRLASCTSVDGINLLIALRFVWLDADYCLSRWMDLQGQQKRTVKKRSISRTQIALMRRELDDHYAKAAITMTETRTPKQS